MNELELQQNNASNWSTHQGSIKTTSEVSDAQFTLSDVVMLLILLLATTGNLLLIFVVVRVRRLKRLIDKYILNLSICDLCLVLISIPTHFAASSSVDYPFGIAGCKVIDPLGTMAVNSSVFTLVAIAQERLQAVQKPMKIASVKKPIWHILVGIHLASFVLIIPYMGAKTYRIIDGSRSCAESWNLTSRRIYTIVLTVSQYVVPVPLMIISYVKAWRSVQVMNNRFIRGTMIAESTSTYMVDMISEKGTPKKHALHRERLSASMNLKNLASPLASFRKKHFPSVSLSENDLTSHSCKKFKPLQLPISQKETHPNHQNCIVLLNGTPQKISTYIDDSANSNHGSLSKPIHKDHQQTSPGKHSNSSSASPFQTPTRSKGTLLQYVTSKLRRYEEGGSLYSNNNRDGGKSFIIRMRIAQTRGLLKMFSGVVIVFMLCMLPSQILWLMIDFNADGDNASISSTVVSVAYTFTYANCVLNPLIYGWLNKNFRKDIMQVFRHIRCR